MIAEEPEESEEPEIIYKKKPKVKKSRTVYVESSDSDDGSPEIIYKKKPLMQRMNDHYRDSDSREPPSIIFR